MKVSEYVVGMVLALGLVLSLARVVQADAVCAQCKGDADCENQNDNCSLKSKKCQKATDGCFCDAKPGGNRCFCNK